MKSFIADITPQQHHTNHTLVAVTSFGMLAFLFWVALTPALPPHPITWGLLGAIAFTMNVVLFWTIWHVSYRVTVAHKKRQAGARSHRRKS